MEESNQSTHTASSSSTTTSLNSQSTGNGEYSGVASTSLINSQVQEEENAAEVDEGNPERHSELIEQRMRVSHNAPSTVMENDQAMGWMRDDSWSCIVIILTFCFFVSASMIMGVYGSARLLLGPNSSILIKPSSYFVEYVKIEELYEAANGNGPMLYGFYKDPPLDVVIPWSETHNSTILSGTHEDWIYFLNEGSQINISYTVNSTSSSSLVLVIAQGNEGLSRWLEDPSYPNTTLLWQVIQGTGMIQQDIFTSSSYYVAIGNLNAETVEVQLNVRLGTLLYNTTGAYYMCSFAQGQCSVKFSLLGGNTALLTSPGPTPGGRARDEWCVKLSYGHRWIAYLAVIGGVTVLMLAAFHVLNYLHCALQDGRRIHFGEIRSERTPLIPNKDDDLSSWGSSYDSVSQDDEDPEGSQSPGLLEGKPVAKDGEYNNNNIRRLCAICFDAPRDCFFLPCGHCVACFTCGTRIAEAAATCPICRRHMKKVRKIFAV